MATDWSSTDDVFENSSVLQKKIPRLNYITEDKWSVWYVRSFWHAIQIMITGDTKRETNLKNEMEIVRRMILWLISNHQPRVNLSNR